MPEPVTPFEQNLSAWLRTASLADLVVLLESLGRELLVQRGAGPVEQAGVDALRAANRLRPLAATPIGSHAASLEFLDRAAAKYQGARGGS